MSTTLPVTGNTTKTQPENRAFYPALDGMRALAFVMVFLHHYLLVPWGWAGVDLFFVLSGFLITGILFDTRNDRFRIRNFYLRRTLRIFPLYYGIMILLLLLLPVFHWHINWKWAVWPAYVANWLHAFYLAPGSPRQQMADFHLIGTFHHHRIDLFLGHFWTLCVEEQFYLLWPFVVFWVRDLRKLMWICALSLPVCLVARLVSLADLPTWMLEQDVLAHLTVFRLDALLLGGLLALVLRSTYREHLLRWSRWLLMPSLLAAFVWAFLLPVRRLHWGDYPYGSHTLTVGLTLIDMLSALLLLNALQPDTWLASAFALRPLRWLGRLSYGAYVFHDIFHLLYTRVSRLYFGSSQAATALIGFITTLLLAWASFRFFEAPFLNLKDRYTLGSEGRPQSPPALLRS